MGWEERFVVFRVKNVLGAFFEKLEAGTGLDRDPVFVLNPLFLHFRAVNSKQFFLKLSESIIDMRGKFFFALFFTIFVEDKTIFKLLRVRDAEIVWFIWDGNFFVFALQIV